MADSLHNSQGDLATSRGTPESAGRTMTMSASMTPLLASRSPTAVRPNTSTAAADSRGGLKTKCGRLSSSIAADSRRMSRIRGPAAAAATAAASSAGPDGMYAGTVLFHLYPDLKDPKPIFTTFLEAGPYTSLSSA